MGLSGMSVVQWMHTEQARNCAASALVRCRSVQRVHRSPARLDNFALGALRLGVSRPLPRRGRTVQGTTVFLGKVVRVASSDADPLGKPREFPVVLGEFVAPGVREYQPDLRWVKARPREYRVDRLPQRGGCDGIDSCLQAEVEVPEACGHDAQSYQSGAECRPAPAGAACARPHVPEAGTAGLRHAETLVPADRTARLVVDAILVRLVELRGDVQATAAIPACGARHQHATRMQVEHAERAQVTLGMSSLLQPRRRDDDPGGCCQHPPGSLSYGASSPQLYPIYVVLAYHRHMSDETRRTTVILVPKAQEALDKTVERTGLSKTDVINRAVQAYAFLEREAAAGAKILVQRGKATEEVRFL